ncbi:MAG: SCP2 sterol-binding domain-containing protein [Betaproteobacteria bacterium]|nr:SCP2 sterol-binding domain-containing protein [Betaproteobacteria bacterium]
MATLESPLVLALNRLLEAEAWARERLAPFAGETVEFRAPPLPALRFSIVEGGRLVPGTVPTLSITLQPESLPALFRGEEHLMRTVGIEGNAQLAQEVLHLARHLRWDAEEDLSKLVGDAAAHRVAGLACHFAAWQVDAARRLAEGFLEYAQEDGRLLAPRAAYAALTADIARLRDALERLEKRIERLS